MIMPWNRKEVFLGFLLKDFYKALNILKVNQIKYVYRIINLNNGNRGLFGNAGENPDFACEYYVYVNKQDYEKADFLLKKDEEKMSEKVL